MFKYRDNLKVTGLGKLFLIGQNEDRAIYCDSSDREYELVVDNDNNFTFKRIDNNSRLAIGGI